MRPDGCEMAEMVDRLFKAIKLAEKDERRKTKDERRKTKEERRKKKAWENDKGALRVVLYIHKELYA